MPDIDRREFDLLLNEKEHIDGQISNFLDLEIKILTFLFPALGVALGWIFKVTVLSPNARSLILVGAAAFACFGILMSIGTYATALAYVHYKTIVLGEKFQKLLNLTEHPFATRLWSESPAAKVLNAATGILWLLVFIFTVSLLIAAWRVSAGRIHILVIICAILLAIAVVLAMFLGRAILVTGALPPIVPDEKKAQAQ